MNTAECIEVAELAREFFDKLLAFKRQYFGHPELLHLNWFALPSREIQNWSD